MAATNFSSLRSQRKNALDKLNQEIQKESQTQKGDERFWKLTVDPKTKIGYAELRFLPEPKGEDVPWVRLWSHGFKINGSWYIENCPTTLGQRSCPVCKENNKLWNSGIDADKEIARDRKRKLNFISNVLVVRDDAHTENNGKVFLFRYGAKIHDKIQELINPQYPDQSPLNPFDLWAGATFKLKSGLVKGYQNYDKSEFADPEAAPYGDRSDAAYEELWGKEYSLSAFVAEDQFKSFEELDKRFKKVLYGDDAPKSAVEAIKNEEGASVAAAVSAAASVEAVDVSEAKAAARKPRATAKKETAEVKAAEAGPQPPETPDDIKAFFAGVTD